MGQGAGAREASAGAPPRYRPPVTTRTLTPDQAARVLVAHHGLARPVHPAGAAGVRALLAARRCIQLDPLDPIGTNADLVALARLDGVGVGEVYDHLLPGHAFEHFAKERCLLPAAAFPHYRARAAETPWWRAASRQRRLDEGLLADVLAEVEARGPVALSDLSDRGRVEALDWSGWKGTGKATTMATEVLWRRCRIVIAGRSPRGKILDVPARALPDVAEATVDEPFERWALRERVAACGLMPRRGGPWWGVLRDTQKSDLPERMVAEGALVAVGIPGTRRTWLAPADLPEEADEADERLRILGPLDPLLWDRALVEHVFGFAYVWEVYKPAAKRRWGWYVVPLLHRGRLVGRLEAHTADGRLVVDRVWKEAEGFDDAALAEALDRHAAALGVAPPGVPNGGPRTPATLR